MILLDTCILIFDALTPERSRGPARNALVQGQAKGTLACADISLWEIAMLWCRQAGDGPWSRQMNRDELRRESEVCIRSVLRDHVQDGTAVYLYGSRARGDAAWNSDYDLWIDADLPDRVIAEIIDALDESIVPFHVDIVTTPSLRGAFGERVRAEARRWM